MHMYIEFHRWLLAFPEISIVEIKALVPLSCFKQILNKLAKSYTKEDDNVLLEIPG